MGDVQVLSLFDSPRLLLLRVSPGHTRPSFARAVKVLTISLVLWWAPVFIAVPSSFLPVRFTKYCVAADPPLKLPVTS